MGGGPKISRFFSLSPATILVFLCLSGGLCTFGVLGLSCGYKRLLDLNLLSRKTVDFGTNFSLSFFFPPKKKTVDFGTPFPNVKSFPSPQRKRSV